MSGPIVYASVERELITYLTAMLIGRPEAYVPTDVAAIAPTFPTTLTASATAVQVQHETTADTFPATRERPQTRVTCWAAADRRTDVKALASLVLGLLEQFPGTSALTRVRPVIGRSGVVTDPDTKNVAVWFLVEANLHGTQLEA